MKDSFMEEYAYLLSDLHTEQQQYRAEKLPAGNIILAGDIANGTHAFNWLTKHEHRVLYVMGNHEYYGHNKLELDSAIKNTKFENVQTLLCTAIETKTAYIMGSTLWAGWDAMDERANQNARQLSEDAKKIQLTDNQAWTPEMAKCQHMFEKQQLQTMWRNYKGNKTKIIVTHHPPTPMSLIKAGMPVEWTLPNAFDELTTIPAHSHRLASYTSMDEEWFADAAKHGVKLWCHGHLHRGLDYIHHGIRVVCNPKGYRKEKRAPNYQYKEVCLNLTNPIDQWLRTEKEKLHKAIEKQTENDYAWAFLSERVRDWHNVYLRANNKPMTAKADYEKSKLLDTLGMSF